MNIIFHFGPPKTGTSAIQKWLSTNNNWLLTRGIYYPQHSLDPNGVSSGNLRSIFSGDKGNFEFSQKLFNEEVEKGKEKACHTIIFSSEFFFRNLEILGEQVPEAKFVGYLRFGLETLQSSYNQAVKRHGRTTVFAPGNHIQSTLSTLSIKIAKVGESRFILRPYSKSLFFNHSLIPDFLETVGIDASDVNTSIGRVNPSYSPAAIEVKRWFNQLESASLQTRLDLALQGYGDEQPFSLLSDDIFEKSKSRYLLQLKRFLDKHEVKFADQFYAECAQLENHPYKAQNLSEKQFEKVLKDIVSHKKLTYLALYTAYVQAKANQHELNNPERVEILNRVVPWWVKAIAKIKAALSLTKSEGER